MRILRPRWPLRRDHWVRQIEQMNPQTDWAQIYGITTGHEFPWDSQRASEIALVHTYAVPEIGELLARTGELIERTEKRFDDTAIILVESGNYIGGETRDPTAIRRLNRMHGAYDIPHDQMLYVLTTFVVVTRRWIDRYGYRPMMDAEVESMVRYWQRMGELMNISDIPADYEGFADYLDTYERERFGFSPGGRAVSDATFTLFQSRFPEPLRALVHQVLMSAIAPHLRRALGYPDPPAAVSGVVDAALRLRKRIIGLLPARREYLSPRDRMPLPTYPHGYDLSQVGTFPEGQHSHPPSATTPA